MMAGLVVLGGAAGAVAWQFNLRELLQACLDWVRAQGAGVFFAAMALLPLAAFPLAPFVLSAGPVFAPTMGAGLVIACGIGALAVNVSLSYWFGAYGLRPWLERLIVWLGYSVPVLPKNRALEAILLLRVVPGVPFFLQNYLLGLARVPFALYLPLSVAMPAIHLTVAVLAGDALMKGDRTGLFVALGLFLVVCAGLHLLRKGLKAKRDAQAGTVEPR